ncbi:OCIA domain-containing protein 1-like [Nerophis lumbriciformis]|uniref:OCIA domain-containing protein 1-like n=1 Tax=Nerophis lumbriciformis TaxID=546530 RepID=UPI002ADF206B|nr:OCIA domain-containing protein 1-like [Nerophis lumbriciformis]
MDNMSSTTAGFDEEMQQQGAQVSPTQIPNLRTYIPTEEERRVMKECRTESLIYRELPLAAVGAAVGHALVVKGFLSASPKVGSLHKVAFGALFGFMWGLVSYIPTCQEKIKKLDNSPLAMVLRRQPSESEMSDPDAPSFDAMFQPAEDTNQTPQRGYPRRSVDFNAPVQTDMEGDVPKRKATLYEDLRLKNRENYEVMQAQKTETPLKAPPEKEWERPTKNVKTNSYGDTWEE